MRTLHEATWSSRDGCVRLYRQDCLEWMLEYRNKQLPPFDHLVTDPPYGIDENSKKVASRGKPFGSKGSGQRKALAYAKDYGEFQWDQKTCNEHIETARDISVNHAIFGGNYYRLPPTSCWLIWDKLNGETDFADVEMCWTNWKKAARLKRHLWNGMLREGQERRFHPTQKPLEIMKWVLNLAPATKTSEAPTVIDPFAGSGTTGVACVAMGMRFVGIEREPRYFDTMVDRIKRAYHDTSLLTLAEA